MKNYMSQKIHSAYQLIQKCVMSYVGDCSHSSDLIPLWRDFWKMKVPNKVRLFAWRAGTEGLPSLANLKKSISSIDSSCIFCRQSLEDTAHALFYCQDLHRGWLNFMPLLIDVPTNLNFLKLVVWVKQRKEPEALTFYFIIAWSLWKMRNKEL